jgi:hypothetical protein
LASVGEEELAIPMRRGRAHQREKEEPLALGRKSSREEELHRGRKQELAGMCGKTCQCGEEEELTKCGEEEARRRWGGGSASGGRKKNSPA